MRPLVAVVECFFLMSRPLLLLLRRVPCVVSYNPIYIWVSKKWPFCARCVVLLIEQHPLELGIASSSPNPKWSYIDQNFPNKFSVDRWREVGVSFEPSLSWLTKTKDSFCIPPRLMVSEPFAGIRKFP